MAAVTPVATRLTVVGIVTHTTSSDLSTVPLNQQSHLGLFGALSATVELRLLQLFVLYR